MFLFGKARQEVTNVFTGLGATFGFLISRFPIFSLEDVTHQVSFWVRSRLWAFNAHKQYEALQPGSLGPLDSY